MLNKNSVPPQPGMPFQLNHKFPSLEKMNVVIPAHNIPFVKASKPDAKRRLLINNFDASVSTMIVSMRKISLLNQRKGGNCCLLVEDPPQRSLKSHDTRVHHIIVCSARTHYSLTENKRRLLKYLSSHPESKISDVAYTTTARRSHEVFRSSYCADTTEELARLLTMNIAETDEASIKPANKPISIVFAFTGQGSSYSGMGSHLFRTSPRFRGSISSYQTICNTLGLPAVVDMIANGDADISGAMSTSIVKTQLALVFLELALADLWMSWGVRPTLLIGHSLGEYSALCVSGVLSVSDTLYLVAKRAVMMQQKCAEGSHTMLAVRASAETLEDTVISLGLVSCQVACLNSQSSTVVSGSTAELDSLRRYLGSLKITSTLLEVPYGFHSAHMDPILTDFNACARGIPFAKPQIPIASTLTGTVIGHEGVFSPTYLARQAREPVNLVHTLQDLKSDAYVDEETLWVEIGPDPVCLGFIQSSLGLPSTKLLPTIKSNENAWKIISNSLALMYASSAAINWVEYHRDYVNELTLLLLPTYAFDVKDYWCTYKTKDLPAPEIVPEPSPLEPKLTTCLQYVEEETSNGDGVSVSFLSYTSDQQFFDVIQGHLVDGAALCPASVFCDMAYTAAKYIYEKVRPGEPVPDMSLWALKITQALVVPLQNPDHIVRVLARETLGINWSVNVSFTSTEYGSPCDHGSCQIRFRGDDHLKSSSATILHLVQKRSDALVSSAAAGLSHRLLKPIIYKLFASLVSYEHKYQSIAEVFLDNNHGDAVAIVKLMPNIGTGDFTCSPYWIDAIVHLAGFLLNGDVNKPDDVAYIATGFESLFLYEDLSAESTYTCYACVRPAENNGVFAGDVYLSQGDKVIAHCANILFQKMTKSALSIILGKTSRNTRLEVGPQAITPTTQPQGHNGSPIRMQRQPPNSNISGNSSSPDFTPDEDPVDTPSQQSVSLDRQVGSSSARSLLATVASETGFDIKHMESSTSFSDMGVDSLMSIAIISKAQRHLGLNLPASFFIEHPTVRDVRQELEPVARESFNERVAKGSLSPTVHQKAAPTSEFSTSEVIKTRQHKATKTTRSSSLAATPIPSPQGPTKPLREWTSDVMLVQGRTSSRLTPLFLIPGGAGSATAFIHLPALPNGTKIYSLESPFLKSPLEYTCSIETISSIFMRAIRKIQPRGPYIIGGWSVGAVHAYEVARQLLEQNEEVLGLIIMDMRVPQPMPDVLDTVLELIDRTDMVTGISRTGQPQNPAPKEMKEHLLSNVKALMKYTPMPMKTARRPHRTFLIWAKHGLFETWNDEDTARGTVATVENEGSPGNVMEDPRTGLKAWFFSKRSSFCSNGWDKLVGDVECHVIGANHFSMMQPPHVSQTIPTCVMYRCLQEPLAVRYEC